MQPVLKYHIRTVSKVLALILTFSLCTVPLTICNIIFATRKAVKFIQITAVIATTTSMFLCYFVIQFLIIFIGLGIARVVLSICAVSLIADTRMDAALWITVMGTVLQACAFITWVFLALYVYEVRQKNCEATKSKYPVISWKRYVIVGSTAGTQTYKRFSYNKSDMR